MKKTNKLLFRLLPATLALVLSSCATTQVTEPTVDSDMSEAAPGDRIEPSATEGPLTLDVQAAVLMALDNNAAFQVERVRPDLSRTAERLQRAAFDPTIGGSLSAGSSGGTDDYGASSVSNLADKTALEAGLSLAASLPTGTSVELGLEAARESGGGEESETTGWSITVSQSLLRGRGLDANLTDLRSAKLETRITLYQLRGSTEALISQVEQAYWDCVLNERSLGIYEESHKLANREIDEVRERISVGKVAGTELAAAEAEAASRLEQLIEARANLAKSRLVMIRHLNPGGGDSAWSRELVLTDPPELAKVDLAPVEVCVETAMTERTDLNEARLRLAQGELEVVRTKNGLLPRLDLFMLIGGSRYANSFSTDTDQNADEIAYSAGLSFEIPLGNRGASAQHDYAMLSMKQAHAALRNMEQLVQVDVRSAHIDVGRAEERVNAARATRELREKTLGNEQEKFQVGRSTMFLVSQATRDLVASQIGEIEAVIKYRRALLDLYRLDGSLLTRKGIAVRDRTTGPTDRR
ncbi:MAG: TolC family protein [Lentisphaerales bacterium]|nr:MAG: TolC family protein [Lentisphaerales bacterium]